jgi:hypothetical protein
MLVQLKHLAHPPAIAKKVIEAWAVLLGFDEHAGEHSSAHAFGTTPDLFSLALKHLKEPHIIEAMATLRVEQISPERVRA